MRNAFLFPAESSQEAVAVCAGWLFEDVSAGKVEKL